MSKMKLFLKEEDIEALNHIGFDPDSVLHIRNELEKHHKRIYDQITNDFLHLQYSKILRVPSKAEAMQLMLDIVNWKDNYKSPYLKDTK